MRPVTIEGYTRILGQAQGMQSLPVKDCIMMDHTTGNPTPAMVTEWELTDEEQKLHGLDGDWCLPNIRVVILGYQLPPLLVEVV